MQIAKQLKEKYSGRPKKSQYLHSPAHLLADQLSAKLGEPKRFGFYLKTALKHDHNLLRKILGEVLESRAKIPGALFTFLLQKEKLLNSKITVNQAINQAQPKKIPKTKNTEETK